MKSDYLLQSIGFIFLIALGIVSFPFTSMAADIGFGLRDVDLKLAGNTGPVTFMVNGSGLTADTTVSLTDSQGNLFNAGKVVRINQYRALVTVDLTGAEAGNASINATQDGTNRALPGAMEIKEDAEGELEIKLDTPPEIVAGQPTPVWVSYANTGTTDIDIPLLVLSAGGADYLGREPEGDNMGENAFILGVPDGPVATSLRPGEQVSIPFFVRWEDPATATATLSAISPDDPSLYNGSFDYISIPPLMSDPNNPANAQYLEAIQNEYGNNMGEFYQHELQQLGDMADNIDNVGIESLQNINGRWDIQEKIDIETVRPEFPAYQSLQLDSTPPPQQPPGSNGGDGIERTHVIIIGINDYDNFDFDKGDLQGPVNDANQMYNYFRYNLRIPESQITFLTKKYGYESSITKEVFNDSILNCGADGDDNLVLFFAGHGSFIPETPGSDEYVGALCLSNTSLYEDVGYLRADELTNLLNEKGAGNNIVMLDACHSGSFVNEVSSPHTAIFAAAQADETAGDAYWVNQDETQGFWSGAYTPFLIYYLRQGLSLEEAHHKAKASAEYYYYDQHAVYEPDHADIDYPFGLIDPQYLDAGSTEVNYYQEIIAYLADTFLQAYNIEDEGITPPETLLLQWHEEALQQSNGEYNTDYYSYVNDRITEWRGMNNRLHLCTARVIPVVSAPPAQPPSFTPAGLAVSGNYRLFYISDNGNSRLIMLNPMERKHRILTLIKGLNQVGDVDLGDDGRSLVYVTNGGVQRTFFGFTAFAHDPQGNPLSGAKAVLETADGQLTGLVDEDGYITVMDLLKPSLNNRQLFMTLYYGNSSQLFPITLRPTDQTFVKLEYTADPNDIKPPIYDQNSTWTPEEPFNPGPGDGDTEEKIKEVRIPVVPGQTTIAPTVPVYVQNPPVTIVPTSSHLPTGCGSALEEGPDIKIIAPMDGLQSSNGSQQISGIVCDSSVSEVTVEIDGTPQSVPVVGGQFSLNLALDDGSHSITVSGVNSQSVSGSDNASIDVDSTQPVNTGALTGFVQNQYGYPAIGANVFNLTTGQMTETDQHGLYQFSDLNSGDTVIQVTP